MVTTRGTAEPGDPGMGIEVENRAADREVSNKIMKAMTAATSTKDPTLAVNAHAEQQAHTTSKKQAAPIPDPIRHSLPCGGGGGGGVRT